MRHRSSPLASRPLPAWQPDGVTASALRDAELLDLADPAQGAHVLLIGSGTLELMCALIRRGCLSAAAIGLADHPRAGLADIALVPHANTPRCVEAAVALAERALERPGSLTLRLAGHSPEALSRHARRILQLHGFSAVQSRTLGGQRLLTAELHARGRVSCA